MAMTTMGSEYWPKTLEGRILSYITATIASHLVRLDTERADPGGDEEAEGEAQAVARRQAQQALADTARETAALRTEIAALREQIIVLYAHTDGRPPAQTESEVLRR